MTSLLCVSAPLLRANLKRRQIFLFAAMIANELSLVKYFIVIAEETPASAHSFSSLRLKLRAIAAPYGRGNIRASPCAPRKRCRCFLFPEQHVSHSAHRAEQNPHQLHMVNTLMEQAAQRGRQHDETAHYAGYFSPYRGTHQPYLGATEANSK